VGALAQLHGCPFFAEVVQTVNVAPGGVSIWYSISFVFCPWPQVGSVQEASVRLIGSETSATTLPFVGSTLALVLLVVGVVCFFASVGQLPPPPTQAQERSTVALPVTQMLVLPTPPTSTWTPSVVVLHEKSLTWKDCAQALPGKATPAHTSAAKDATAINILLFFITGIFMIDPPFFT
jgi:hypothetical protein